ncbi:hypothetical protein C9374_006606 [Naegleria lovaniensis]|uniref:Copine C-terminal domain-containing protein n=1 Tax=Naegleria lovaniensis TaxID=51637 RepID=A0AA88GL30_NAELO|nr:uncharacterized protein C9374_006606 [Naegleria lovaniensis]KAG2379489.1 hypothetical protein C9374_006606 [Naegleria lovaniensis]
MPSSRHRRSSSKQSSSISSNTNNNNNNNNNTTTNNKSSWRRKKKEKRKKSIHSDSSQQLNSLQQQQQQQQSNPTTITNSSTTFEHEGGINNFQQQPSKHPRIPLLWTKTPPSNNNYSNNNNIHSSNNSPVMVVDDRKTKANASTELNSHQNLNQTNHHHHYTLVAQQDPQEDQDAQLMGVMGEFPTLSFCDLMLLGSNPLDVKNSTSSLSVTSPIIMNDNNFHHTFSSMSTTTTNLSSTPSSSSSSRKHFHSTSNSTGSINLPLTSSFGKENLTNSSPMSVMKTMSPLAPSVVSSNLVTKPLSLDISKLKPKSNPSPSSCVTPEVANDDNDDMTSSPNIRLTNSEKKASKYRERSFSFGSKKAASTSGSLSHRGFNISSSSGENLHKNSSSSSPNHSTNMSSRMQQGMSFSKWTELIQNNGAFARINNLSSNHSSPSNSPNMLHPQHGVVDNTTTDDSNMSGDVMSSHDSSDIFDQLEDILSYQHPTSPRYRTYSKSENHEHLTTNMENLSPKTTEIGNSQSLDLQFALIGSRGGTRKIEDWMKENMELRKSEIPSLRESRASTESRKGVPTTRLTSKSRSSFNSRSAIDLNATKIVKNIPSISDDMDSDKSSSFSEGNSPSFRPRRKKRSESHIVVNASVCLHFAIDNFKGLEESLKQERQKLEQKSSGENDLLVIDNKFPVQLHVLHRVKKSNDTYIWLPLVHTHDVDLLTLQYSSSFSSNNVTNHSSNGERNNFTTTTTPKKNDTTNVNDIIKFQTTATLPFHFEKITPLLFALVSTRTNNVLGSYEGCLAEICGAQRLLIRRKLIKQKKHFCDIVIQATFPHEHSNPHGCSSLLPFSQQGSTTQHPAPIQFNKILETQNFTRHNKAEPSRLFTELDEEFATMEQVDTNNSESASDLTSSQTNEDFERSTTKSLLTTTNDSKVSKKKKLPNNEVYLDFDEIQAKLEKKYKDCFLVVSQQFFTEKDQTGSFIPLYTSETNTKSTKTPSFEPFTIKPTLEFKIIRFRFELFYWETVSKQQFDELGDVATPRYSFKQSSSQSSVISTIGHYKTLIGAAEVLYQDFIKFFDSPVLPSSLPPPPPPLMTPSVPMTGVYLSNTLEDKKNETLLLGPFFHISNTGLNEVATRDHTNASKKNRKSLKNVTFDPTTVLTTTMTTMTSDTSPSTTTVNASTFHTSPMNNNSTGNNSYIHTSNGGNNSSLSSSSHKVSPLTVRLYVDKRIHVMKEETLAPQGMDPIEDENNPSVVHRRRKVLSVVSSQNGSLTFKKVKERVVQLEEQSDLDVTYTFLDYMKTGLRFKCYFALDFTKDNTEPRNDNLHNPPKGQKSIYEQCMESISKRIFQYDPNMTDFHLVGFGNDRHEPVFNLYSKGEEASDYQASGSFHFNDTSTGSQDVDSVSQNYIFSVLYPRYYPPLKIHQLSPIYRQYTSSTPTYKLSMQDCVKTSHYAFTETNVHKGTRDLTNANKHMTYEESKSDPLKRISSPEFVHLNVMRDVNSSSISGITNSSSPPSSLTTGRNFSQNDEKRRFSTGTSKGNLFDSGVFNMASKYAPNDYYPVISDVIDLSCNLKNEESITQTLLYLYRERQMAKKGYTVSNSGNMTSMSGCNSNSNSNSKMVNDDHSSSQLSLNHINPVLYNLLVILIPNDFIHVEETIYKYVEASHKAALSILVIGVGSGCSFKTHRSINFNNDVFSNNSSCSSGVGSSGGERKSIQYRIQSTLPTTSDLQYRGLKASRNCVTFVRLNDYETVNEAIEAALKDIPKQVCRYMKMKGKLILSPDNK